jgi:hypothetical protein
MKAMTGPPKDLPNANDNLPVEKQLTIVLNWATQAGYVNVATTLRRAIVELEASRKLAELEARPRRRPATS